MNKNTLFWILLLLVFIFFVFRMGNTIHEGFKSCKKNSDCPNGTRDGFVYKGSCGRIGVCGLSGERVK